MIRSPEIRQDDTSASVQFRTAFISLSRDTSDGMRDCTNSYKHTYCLWRFFMTIQPREARQLCSKSEWELVESSFYPLVEALPVSDLKSRLDRARKLYRKTLDLITVQHSDSR